MAASWDFEAADGRGVGVGGCCGSGAAVAAVFAAGSGVMMLTGGIEAAEGNSAFVGLPVGTEAPSMATAEGIVEAASCAAVHDADDESGHRGRAI